MLLNKDSTNYNNDILCVIKKLISLLAISFTDRSICQLQSYKVLQIIKIYNTSYFRLCKSLIINRDFLKSII